MKTIPLVWSEEEEKAFQNSFEKMRMRWKNYPIDISKHEDEYRNGLIVQKLNFRIFRKIPLSEEEIKALEDYVNNIMGQRASGGATSSA